MDLLTDGSLTGDEEVKERKWMSHNTAEGGKKSDDQRKEMSGREVSKGEGHQYFKVCLVESDEIL